MNPVVTWQDIALRLDAAVLAGLKQIEPRLYREHRAELKLRLAHDRPSTANLRAVISGVSLTITNFGTAFGAQREIDAM